MDNYRQQQLSHLTGDGSGQVQTKTCNRCRRFFQYSGVGHIYCPICKLLDAEDFEKVKDYIYENGASTMDQISDATGVGTRIIRGYLRESRLEIPENSPIYIKCELCNTDIRSGRLCAKCASSLSHALRVELNFDEYEIGDEPKGKKVEKMRFLDKAK